MQHRRRDTLGKVKLYVRIISIFIIIESPSRLMCCIKVLHLMVFELGWWPSISCFAISSICFGLDAMIYKLFRKVLYVCIHHKVTVFH